MSAVNAIVQPHGQIGVLQTDIVASDREGAFIHCVSKTLTVPHAQAAVGFRGPNPLQQLIWGAAQLFSSFDEMTEHVQTVVGSEYPGWLQRAGLADGGEWAWCEYTAVGWSQSLKRVRAFHASSRNLFAPQFSDVHIGPALSVEQLFHLGLIERDGGFAFRDGASKGLLDVMRTQRQTTPGPIGGAAVETTITEHGIQQRVVHRWPDQIGQHPSRQTMAAA